MRIVNRIKYILWNHGLIFLLLFFNIIPLYTALAIKPILIDYNGNITPAILYQSMALLGIFAGYVLNPIKPSQKRRIQVRVDKSFFYFLISLSFFGVFIAYKNISMFTSIGDLQSMLVEGDDISGLRAETGDGGIGGIFKMFGTVPLFTFLASSSLLLFFDYSKRTKKILVATLVVSLLFTLIKVMLVFDRLSVLAILIVFVYTFFFNSSFPKIFKIGVISLLLMLVSFLTLIRMSDIGLGEFLGTYFNLGVYNLELSIEHQQHFNYDFSQTFLAPLYFVFKFFGIPYHSYVAEQWVWNPAQSFWGFFFIDFNWFGLLLMPLIGVGIKKIETAKFSNKFWAMMYFVFAYTMFSLVTIPAFRGPEFMLMLFVAYISARRFVKIAVPVIHNSKVTK